MSALFYELSLQLFVLFDAFIFIYVMEYIQEFKKYNYPASNRGHINTSYVLLFNNTCELSHVLLSGWNQV